MTDLTPLPLRVRASAERAATPLRALWARLLNAFVAQIEPLVARVSGSAWCVASLDGESLVLHSVRNGQVEAALRLASGERAPDAVRRSGVDLRLGDDLFLRRTLRLPDAGRNFLRPIIEHQLERLTPWRPETVLYDFDVAAAAGEDGTIAVDLIATSSDLVAPKLARLEAAGLVATTLSTAAEPTAAVPRFDLYRGRTTLRDSYLRALVSRIAAGTFLILGPACIASFLLASSAEDDLDSLKVRLIALRGRIDGKSDAKLSRVQRLLNAKQTEEAVVVLVDRLAKALPDSAVLRELEVDRTRIRLVGRSGNAPSLIPVLAAETGLKEPRFAAPVIRDADRYDAFDIIATRVTQPGPVR